MPGHDLVQQGRRGKTIRGLKLRREMGDATRIGELELCLAGIDMPVVTVPNPPKPEPRPTDVATPAPAIAGLRATDRPGTCARAGGWPGSAGLLLAEKGQMKWLSVAKWVAIGLVILLVIKAIRDDGGESLKNSIEKQNNGAAQKSDTAPLDYDGCLDAGRMWAFDAGECTGPSQRGEN